MKKQLIPFTLILSICFVVSCGNDDGVPADDDDETSEAASTPTAAFDEFNSDAVTVTFSGDEVTLVSNALPNHTSPYWSQNEDLYIQPIIAQENSMSPGNIQQSSYTLTVAAAPELAAATTATGLGAIGISVTGVPIYNQSEGPTDVTDATASGFDWAGGHSGPTGYHYHIEARDVGETSPLPIDSDGLVGIMSDGFLLYGRKCNSTGTYPTDVDESHGHTHVTQHGGEPVYHYHIKNEIYLNQYYLLFGVDLQGTPSSIM